MKRFSVGQRVVAVKNSEPISEHYTTPQYKYGQTFIVKGVLYCCHCGVQWIDIGLSFPLQSWEEFSDDQIECGNCNKSQPVANTDIAWCDSSDFAPITEIDDLINAAIESEDYETAAVLRDTTTS